MVDPDSIRDLYHLAQGALNSVRQGVSSAQTSDVVRQSVNGFFDGETPAAEVPAEQITPNFDLPEDV